MGVNMAKFPTYSLSQHIIPGGRKASVVKE
jgi:hypothetical protein